MPRHSSNGKEPSALDRVIMQATGDGRSVGLPDDPARDKFPDLWEWLSTVNVRGDRIKTPARVSIALGPEGTLVQLVDRDLAVSINVACRYLEQSFEALQASLISGSVPIASWGKREPVLRKRRQN